jgi:natural resistance-associated macrophage protein
MIMPHNIFLHSALVQSRVVNPGEEQEAIFLFTIESTLAVLVSLLINISVVAVFAKGFYGRPDAGDIGLANAGHYLGEAYGTSLRIIWALGLCAAGQSSTMTGAYAGQWVMQGYLQLQVKPWKRALITRSMALVPTLGVAMHFGGAPSGLDRLNVYLNIWQSLVLPFALVPLISLAGARSVMGWLVLPRLSLVACWAAVGLVMVANIYLFWDQFGPGGPGLLLGMVAYVALVSYVAWAPTF